MGCPPLDEMKMVVVSAGGQWLPQIPKVRPRIVRRVHTAALCLLPTKSALAYHNPRTRGCPVWTLMISVSNADSISGQMAYLILLTCYYCTVTMSPN